MNLTSDEPNHLLFSIPGNLSLSDSSHPILWRVSLYRHPRPSPHFFPFRLSGDSSLSGCPNDDEPCDKLTRLLRNVILIMMSRWDVPSWQDFSYTGKLAKYAMWIWGMAAGRIEVSQETIKMMVRA